MLRRSNKKAGLMYFSNIGVFIKFMEHWNLELLNLRKLISTGHDLFMMKLRINQLLLKLKTKQSNLPKNQKPAKPKRN